MNENSQMVLMLCGGQNVIKLTASTINTTLGVAITTITKDSKVISMIINSKSIIIILRIKLKTKNDVIQDVHDYFMDTFLLME